MDTPLVNAGDCEHPPAVLLTNAVADQVHPPYNCIAHLSIAGS